MQSVSITTKVVSSNLAHGEVYLIQHYVIKFVSDLRQVGGFPWCPTYNSDCHDITEMLLKVALNTINPPPLITDKVVSFISAERSFRYNF